MADLTTVLAANDIPVKPQLLLDNVAWELLRDSALMRSKDKEHQKTQEEILAIRKRLETYKEYRHHACKSLRLA